MTFIDTHCHLDTYEEHSAESFDSLRDSLQKLIYMLPVHLMILKTPELEANPTPMFTPLTEFTLNTQTLTMKQNICFQIIGVTLVA